jgi:hypothetical protein
MWCCVDISDVKRVFWPVRQDLEGRHQPQQLLQLRPRPHRGCICHLRSQGGCNQRRPGNRSAESPALTHSLSPLIGISHCFSRYPLNPCALCTHARNELFITYCWCDCCADGSRLSGKTLVASFGTTKYCTNFLRNIPWYDRPSHLLKPTTPIWDTAAPPTFSHSTHILPTRFCSTNPHCLYLHEIGEEAVSYTKEDMIAGKHTAEVNSAKSVPSSQPVGLGYANDTSIPKMIVICSPTQPLHVTTDVHI